jgi:hypothetical protein
MSEFLGRLLRDRRGGAGDLCFYAAMSLAVVLSALFATQVAGPYLHARLARVSQTLAGLGSGPALARTHPPGGCGGECAVRVVASPIGYPGLGALNTGGPPAFLVAASPGG